MKPLQIVLILLLFVAGGLFPDGAGRSLAQGPAPGVAAGEPGGPDYPEDFDIPPGGEVEREVVEGTVLELRDLGAGPSLYSDFETGGVELVLDTDEGPVRVLFGPQWQRWEIHEESQHIGHFKQGQQMMVIGFTLPLSAEGDEELDSLPDERPASPPAPPYAIVAEEVRTDEGETFRPPEPETRGEPRE